MKDFVLKSSFNDKKDNIRKISMPFDILAESKGKENNERRMVVFLGENFKQLPGTDLEESWRLINLCLNYVRRECTGYDLYYKPHPKIVEENEAEFLDLSGFKIVGNTVAELFYLKNIKKIKYVFASCSMASRTAYGMGLNSYTFMNIVGTSFDSRTFKGFREFNKDMPPEFFINNFSQPIKENKRLFDDGGLLKGSIQKILSQKTGTVWILFEDPGNISQAAVTARIIKTIEPGRPVKAIIIKHHRWEIVPIEDIKDFFDEIRFIPKIRQSMRPAKILRTIKAALEIRRFPIELNDIIIGIPGLGFSANCFFSYFSKNFKIAMFAQDTFDTWFEERIYSRADFRTRPGALLFSLIVEPLLGLERDFFLEGKQRIFNVGRYAHPINDIYDYVWVFDW